MLSSAGSHINCATLFSALKEWRNTLSITFEIKQRMWMMGLIPMIIAPNIRIKWLFFHSGWYISGRTLTFTAHDLVERHLPFLHLNCSRHPKTQLKAGFETRFRRLQSCNVYATISVWTTKQMISNRGSQHLTSCPDRIWLILTQATCMYFYLCILIRKKT